MFNCKSPFPILLFFLTILCLVQPPAVFAAAVQAEQWEITANKITRYEDPPSVIAEGNVVLTKQETITQPRRNTQQTNWAELLNEGDTSPSKPASTEEVITKTKVLTTISADWVVYDIDLAKIKARGNLVIDIGPDQLSAEVGTIDLNRQTGTFENASILREYKDMHFEGRVIEKTGDLTYHIEDGWFVTCKLQNGETPPWSFAAADASITDGGYALLKHATFRVKGIPILYTPYMILPAKRSRQTGFLFPLLSLSEQDGFGMEIPFFINLSPSSDITLYPRYMAKRGIMAGAEFRYVMAEDSKGTLMGNWLKDSLSNPDEQEYYADGNFTHTNQNRYWIRGKADHNFASWITRMDLDILSDSDYLTEFTTGFTSFNASNTQFLDNFGRGLENKTDESRTNSLTTLRSWDNGLSLEAEILGINDLREDTNEEIPLWKLPALSFTGLLPVAKTGVDFRWNADYVHYWREEGVTAQRFDLFPEITFSVPLSRYLETTMTAGVRDTAYIIDDNGDEEWADSSSANRFLANFNTEISSTLMRDFSINFSRADELKHTLRPYVGYSFISDDDQNDLPQFDSIDNIDNKSLLYYGLDNYFDLYGSGGKKSYGRSYAVLKFRQGYSLKEEDEETPFTPVNLRLEYYPVERFRFIYKTDIDVYDDGWFRHSVEADYKSSRGDAFALDYRYDSVNDINSISGSAWIVLPYHFAAGYSLQRSIEDDQTIEEIYRLLYQAPCWSVELATERNESDTTFMVLFRLANIGAPVGMNF
ncbi:MAG: hypothetical protein CSA34_06750 [Desulfobulbus propionicus]|nr:MAG: hypothetical protein CSA34_06750 [Desulfobulbus propionicus]